MWIDTSKGVMADKELRHLDHMQCKCLLVLTTWMHEHDIVGPPDHGPPDAHGPSRLT